MDVELLMHGVPDGQDFYGVSEEQANMGLFYDNSTESVKFVVEIKKQGGRTFAYYSYLRYKGVIGSGGRPGSYFGLTLRIDKYYQDAIHFFVLLDILFKRSVVGILLSPSSAGYKYLVTNFASKSAEIDKMHQLFLQLIQTTCVSAKFMDINANNLPQITSVPNLNIADANESVITDLIKKHSKVVISPDCEMIVEKECRKKIQEAESNVGNLLSQKDTSINSLKSKVDDLLTKNKSLEQNLKSREVEIQQLKKRGDVSALVSKIKEPIYVLAEYFRSKTPPLTKPNPDKQKYNLINCLLSSIILVLCVFVLIKTPSGLSNNDEELAELTRENDALKKELNEKTATIEELLQKVPVTDASATIALRIDVSGYTSGQKLRPGNSYSVSIKENGKKYGGAGKWRLTHANLKSGKFTDSQITIEPDGNGDVILAYTSNDLNYSCEDRTLPVKMASKPTTATTTNASIVISPTVNEIEIGEEYSFSIDGYSGDGEWRADGFTGLTNKNKNAKTVKLKVVGAEPDKVKATISYTPNGGEKIPKTYNIKIN